MGVIMEIVVEVLFDYVSGGFQFTLSKIIKKRGITKFRVFDYVLMFIILGCYCLYTFREMELVLWIIASAGLALLSALILGTISNLAFVSQSSPEK
ncbi:hypothetical protein [Anoxynatronum sibiricum]|uniref:Uncharacterized protein n=1 Tax=Anoxynatronum sibiricum TaxID=210623 RepID=A0ABU9VVZ8_9CLOT